MPKYYTIKSNFELETLYCFLIDEANKIFPFFQDISNEQLINRDKFAVLGEQWPFTLLLHPAIMELYEKREERAYFEQVTSTVNGIEYLFGYFPLVVDGNVLCVFCGTYTMTNIHNTIYDELKDIEIINIALMILAAAVLLILTYFYVLKNLAFVQKTIREYRQTKDSEAVAEKLKNIHSKNEIGVLADDFSDMAVELERYTKEMVRLSAEK